MTLSEPTPFRTPAPADCKRQRRFRDRAEHDAEPVLADAADDDEDGEVPEDDGPDGRRGGGVAGPTLTRKTMQVLRGPGVCHTGQC